MISTELEIKAILFDEKKDIKDLHSFARYALDNQTPRDELIKTIKAIRLQEIDEESDNLLLDLLDCLTGWCSPHQKL